MGEVPLLQCVVSSDLFYKAVGPLAYSHSIRTSPQSPLWKSTVNSS